MNGTKNLEKRLLSLPEVRAEDGCIQNAYHEFDVYNHTLFCLDEVKKLTQDREVIAASILHDIGKPVVAKPKKDADGNQLYGPDGEIYQTFRGHEKVGEYMVYAMPPQLFEEECLDQTRIAGLVGAHFLPMLGIKKLRKATSYDTFKERFYELEAELDGAPVDKADILTMFLADTIAKGKVAQDLGELKAIRTALTTTGTQREAMLQDIYRTQQQHYLTNQHNYREKKDI